MKPQDLKKLIIFILFSFFMNLYSQNYISVTYTPIVNSIGLQVNKCVGFNIVAGIEKNMFESKKKFDIEYIKIYAGVGEKISDDFIVNIALGYYSFKEIGIDLGFIFELTDRIHVNAYVDVSSWLGLTKGIYAPKIGIGVQF